jgi:hypothetical protein
MRKNRKEKEERGEKESMEKNRRRKEESGEKRKRKEEKRGREIERCKKISCILLCPVGRV